MCSFAFAYFNIGKNIYALWYFLIPCQRKLWNILQANFKNEIDIENSIMSQCFSFPALAWYIFFRLWWISQIIKIISKNKKEEWAFKDEITKHLNLAKYEDEIYNNILNMSFDYPWSLWCLSIPFIVNLSG